MSQSSVHPSVKWCATFIQLQVGRAVYRGSLIAPWCGQGVHSLFEGMPGRPWKEGEHRASRMVFIGRDLDAELLKEGFEACLAQAAEVAV